MKYNHIRTVYLLLQKAEEKLGKDDPDVVQLFKEIYDVIERISSIKSRVRVLLNESK